MVKALGGQRESDGVVVPLIGVQHNAPGGKGPNFDHAREAGKCEGMTGVSRSNYPGKPPLAVADEEPLEVSPVKVRELQRALWAAAKQSSGRRFHALYDRVYRGDVLWEAWERVRKNKGAAGVDRITLVAVEDYGVDRMLRELRHDLRRVVYRPAPARRVEIPKPRGGKRPLGIPTVRDRVAQAAAKIVLEPIFEADFCRARMGFGRSGRRRWRRNACGPASSRATSLWSSSISPISSARSTTTGCSPRWVGGSRIGGCSNCCVCGCKQGCWSMG